MSTLSPTSTFNFSSRGTTPIFSIKQHSSHANYTVCTQDQACLIQTSPSGVRQIAQLNVPNVRSQPSEIEQDTVFCIDDAGVAIVIDWRIGAPVMEHQLPKVELSEDVMKKGNPNWVHGLHASTKRVAYAFGNQFFVTDLRQFQPEKATMFEEMHSQSIRRLVFENNGQTLISAGVDGLIQMFNMEGFNPKADPDDLLTDIINLEDSGVTNFIKQDNLIFSLADDQNLRVHSLEDNLMLSNPLNISEFSASYFVDILPSRHAVVANVYGDLFIASITGVKDQKTIFDGVAVLKGHKEVTTSIAWSGKQQGTFLTGDDTGMLCQWSWDAPQGNPQSEPASHAEQRRHRSMRAQNNGRRHHRPY